MAQARQYDAAMSPGKIRNDSDQINNTVKEGSPKDENQWLMIARDAYNQAHNYFEANIRSDLERNLAHFSNRHAPGSKYHSDNYKHRHKGFRPKTRSMIRRNEAAAAVAMFSTTDLVDVRPARTKRAEHRISAKVNQQLLQYRLENTIPWYETVIGAYQDTLNTGLCISHQYWNYQELPPIASENDGPQDWDNKQNTATEDEEISDSLEGGLSENLEEGAEALLDVDTPLDEEDPLFEFLDDDPIIVKDTPAIDLRPIENVFFNAACDWRDPAGTSPYIIDKMPMYLDDIKGMAKHRTNPWKTLTESQLLTGVTTDYDSVRRQREVSREDSTEDKHLYRGFDIAWVHRNIIRQRGRDYIYYTLGVHFMLSEPVPLEEEYEWLAPGERPYVIGTSNIEAHKNYPDSLNGLGAKTQQEANEINNQRRDNVKLSLNRRYIIKRGSNIDFRGLQRNVPGGVTETDDPNNDIRIEAPPDVTGSAYQEQDRINMDYDELTGMFSGSSVGSNQNMNETVGGLNLLSGDADTMQEYPLRTFVTTWVTKVLKQVIKMEQTHESDEALLTLLGENMQVWDKHGINRITDEWIQGSMNIQVNVGFGATNPQQRVARLATGLQTVLGFAPTLAPLLDGQEVAKEVFGALGFQGTERFFPEEGPAQAAQKAPKEEGSLTEQDSAKQDQNYQIHMEQMQDRQQQREWDAEKFFMEMENKEKDRLFKKEINDDQFEERIAAIQARRQDTVDELKVKLKLGSGI
jgi:hypothetical protein